MRPGWLWVWRGMMSQYVVYVCTSIPVNASGHGILHHVSMTSNCHWGKLVFVWE